MENHKIKKVLIVGAKLNGNDAVSNIISLLIKTTNSHYSFDLVAYGSNENIFKYNNSIKYIVIKDPFKLFYRIVNKLYHILNLENANLSERYLFKKINKYCKNEKYDYVISVSGWFYYTYAAYSFAKKNNINLKIIYFDPFTNNLYTKNRQKRIKDERKWLNHAVNIFYNAENISPLEINKSNKFIPFKIPIYNLKFSKSSNFNFIYGGTFYKEIREPDSIYLLANKILNTNYKIKCYCNLKTPKQNPKIEFYDFIDYNKYLEECSSAKALIYIGNSGKNSVSSKYLEYIGLRKIIIGINVSEDDEVRKYPFYFDYTDDKLIEKIENIDENELNSFNPYSIYKDRNPKELFDRFFN